MPKLVFQANLIRQVFLTLFGKPQSSITMIVPTMSTEEVIKEVQADIAIIMRKAEYTYDQSVRKQLLKTKKFPFVKAYDYVTPKTKNNWIFIIEVKSKSALGRTFINYHYTSIGIRAVTIANETDFIFFTGHLFSRFVEREKLSVTNPVDKIKEFFKLNIDMNCHLEKKLEGGADEFIAYVKTGVVLGIKNKNVVVCNTYLSNEMLRKDQTLMVKGLKEELENYNATK